MNNARRNAAMKRFGASLAAAVLTPALPALAEGNPFSATTLQTGYDIANHDKHAEGKCGEGKCGGDKADKRDDKKAE